MIEILYQDEYIIAINKPNNTLVHHSAMSRNMDDEKSLVELLIDQLEQQFFPVHRLDRKTSGVLLFAKDKSCVKVFQEILTSDAAQKVYLGLVRGFIEASGKIDTPVKGRDANVHKEALTYYNCLKTFQLDIPVGKYPTSRYSLVELLPKTGRLHQLRIHMNKISHPLVGDPKYGDRFHNRMFVEKFNSDKLFLHAHKLNFIHPITNTLLSIEASLPEHWSSFMSSNNQDL